MASGENPAPARGSHGSTLRTIDPEREAIVVVRVHERFQSHAVAREVDAPPAEVHDREREHASAGAVAAVPSMPHARNRAG